MCCLVEKHACWRLKLLLPRLLSERGVCRAPTVGLTVVGALLQECGNVDLFPMSLSREASWKGECPQKLLWQGEAFRLQAFLRSRRPACMCHQTPVAFGHQRIVCWVEPLQPR
jgi:hypothetical protein